MTYRQYIEKVLGRFSVSADDVEVLLLNQLALIPDGNATVDVTVAKRAMALEFTNIIPLANVTEGGYSVSWNWDGIRMWYNQVCKEVGIEPVETTSRPKIRDRSNVW